MKKGTLYIVGTPIGNPEDISLRALEVLRKVDYIACEEHKTGQRLLLRHQIEKELVEVNEHTEKEETEQIILDLAMGQNIALISDCGMPGYASAERSDRHRNPGHGDSRTDFTHDGTRDFRFRCPPVFLLRVSFSQERRAPGGVVSSAKF
jgi:hypothetical protein